MKKIAIFDLPDEYKDKEIFIVWKSNWNNNGYFQLCFKNNHGEFERVSIFDLEGTELRSLPEKKNINKIENFYGPMAEVFIPENATNGDMIKTMFNPYKICEYEYSVHVYRTEEDFWKADYQMNYDTSWWNTPYKVESEK